MAFPSIDTAFSRFVVALDIGGSHVSAARVDMARRDLARGSQQRREADHRSSASDLLDSWASVALLASGTPMPVALAVPSPFDSTTGVSNMTHKFTDLFGVPIREELQRRWVGTHLDHCPITFANDADAWAVGEAWSGRAKPYNRVIGLTLGTGLGSGYVVDGAVVHAGNGVPPEGELWNVPFENGICEDVASGRAVTASFGAQVHASNASPLPHASPLEIAHLASNGNKMARHCFHQLGIDIARIVVSASSAFQADVIVIGGNVARASRWFAPSLRNELSKHFDRPPMVRFTRRYETSTPIGAASMALWPTPNVG